MRKKVLNDLVVLIWRLVAMMSVMRGGWRGEPKNFALKLTPSIFLRQICEFHKMLELTKEVIIHSTRKFCSLKF